MRCIAICAFGAILGAWPQRLAADVVELVPNATVKQATGGSVRGTVQSESAAEVVVKLGANVIHVPTNEIVSIRYDGQPASMLLAESNESSGQFEKAAELYKKAAAEAGAKPFVVQAAKFREASAMSEAALADPGKAAEAVSLIEAFLKANPTSRHAIPMLENLARLQIQQGNYVDLDKTAESIARLPLGAGRAAVIRAKGSIRKGEHEQALQELDKLIRSLPDGSVHQREAQLARAEALAGLKKYDEAEEAARAVIKALPAEDFASQSVAYNTLGDCLRAAGRTKDALIAYLHTDVLYSKDREQHPRALSQIAQLWRDLRRDDRADEAAQRLKQQYPRSPWATSQPKP